MADLYDRITRSSVMRKIGSRNTTPELLVRQAIHRLGIRFRLHRRDLLGKPDIVLPKWKTVVFVHGCFWHCHAGCIDGHLPKSNLKYWGPKLARNRQRDAENIAGLQRLGWRCVVIWECQARQPRELDKILRRTFRPPASKS